MRRKTKNACVLFNISIHNFMCIHNNNNDDDDDGIVSHSFILGTNLVFHTILFDRKICPMNSRHCCSEKREREIESMRNSCTYLHVVRISIRTVCVGKDNPKQCDICELVTESIVHGRFAICNLASGIHRF